MKQLSRVHRKDDLEPQSVNRLGKGWQFWGEARTRILFWYFSLIALFILVSVPLMQKFVFARVDNRVREDLAEEMELFQQFLQDEPEAKAKLRLSSGSGNPPLALPPASPQDFQASVDVYLTLRIPEDDTFILVFVEGQLFRSSTKALPELLQPDSQLGRRWSQLTQSEQGEKESFDAHIGNVIYIAEPIAANGTPLGTIVVTHLTAGERREALEALGTVFQVKAIALALALLFAWLMAGKVLAPLHKLATTAHAISETDLTQRIPVQGNGELAELARTFNDMMDRLESSFSTQRNFINDAGHELRTPITIIRGHLELMDDDPVEQQKTLELVLDELDRMSRFVEDMILLAKSERPDFLRLEVIDLSSLGEELFTKATALADRNWQLETVAKGQMVGDRQRITEAVMNLTQNAAQHTTPQDTIALNVVQVNRSIHFSVRDTGEGIALEDQPRIFERFARATKSRRRSEGAGLGLSIVQAIVEAHGGTIQLRSQPGTGATFTLILPIEPPQERIAHESNLNC